MNELHCGHMTSTTPPLSSIYAVLYTLYYTLVNLLVQLELEQFATRVGVMMCCSLI